MRPAALPGLLDFVPSSCSSCHAFCRHSNNPNLRKLPLAHLQQTGEPLRQYKRPLDDLLAVDPDRTLPVSANNKFDGTIGIANGFLNIF